jgi:hypothetical protein
MKELTLHQLSQVSGGVIYDQSFEGDDDGAGGWISDLLGRLESGGSDSQSASNEGGFTWGQIAAGVAMMGFAVLIVATAGLATVPVGVIIGAGTAGELLIAGAGVTLIGTGAGIATGGVLR